MADYRPALEELYRAPLASFVAERKRLADALRASGHADAAKRLAGRRRPTASAWAVNQLYWSERGAFDDLLAAATQMRRGDLSKTAAYRHALAELRTRAIALLRESAHAATAATIARVTGTLAAVAAAGGFDPEPPGTLAADREPPGFDAVAPPVLASGHPRRPGAQDEHRRVPASASERKPARGRPGGEAGPEAGRDESARAPAAREEAARREGRGAGARACAGAGAEGAARRRAGGRGRPRGRAGAERAAGGSRRPRVIGGGRAVDAGLALDSERKRRRWR